MAILVLHTSTYVLLINVICYKCNKLKLVWWQWETPFAFALTVSITTYNIYYKQSHYKLWSYIICALQLVSCTLKSVFVHALNQCNHKLSSENVNSSLRFSSPTPPTLI